MVPLNLTCLHCLQHICFNISLIDIRHFLTIRIARPHSYLLHDKQIYACATLVSLILNLCIFTSFYKIEMLYQKDVHKNSLIIYV